MSATLGIVVGDIIYITIAILGLSLLIQYVGNIFPVIRYLGGAYLVWLGVSLARNKSDHHSIANPAEISLFSSFMAGLVITLADQKAIIFYLVLFPAFIDIDSLSLPDMGLIILLAAAAIIIPKPGYAWMAKRAMQINRQTWTPVIKLVAGGILVCIGGILLVKP